MTRELYCDYYNEWCNDSDIINCDLCIQLDVYKIEVKPKEYEMNNWHFLLLVLFVVAMAYFVISTAVNTF